MSTKASQSHEYGMHTNRQENLCNKGYKAIILYMATEALTAIKAARLGQGFFDDGRFVKEQGDIRLYNMCTYCSLYYAFSIVPYGIVLLM